MRLARLTVAVLVACGRRSCGLRRRRPPEDNALGAGDWVDRFCASFVEVGDDMSELSANGDLAFVAARASTPDEARSVQRRVRLHGRDLVEALDQLAYNLTDTGPPDVSGGRTFYDGLISSVSGLRTTVREAIVTVAGLDLAEATDAEMTALNESLSTLPPAFTTFQGALDGIPEVPEIEQAYARIGACEGLRPRRSPPFSEELLAVDQLSQSRPSIVGGRLSEDLVPNSVINSSMCRLGASAVVEPVPEGSTAAA